MFFLMRGRDKEKQINGYSQQDPPNHSLSASCVCLEHTERSQNTHSGLSHMGLVVLPAAPLPGPKVSSDIFWVLDDQCEELCGRANCRGKFRRPPNTSSMGLPLKEDTVSVRQPLLGSSKLPLLLDELT